MSREEILGKWLALGGMGVLAAILIIWDAGILQGAHMIGVAVMFAVYLRLVLNLFYRLIGVDKLKLDWYLLLVLGTLYPMLMMYLNKQQILIYAVLVGTSSGLGYFVIERLFFRLFK